MRFITSLFIFCIVSMDLAAQTHMSENLSKGVFSGQIGSIYTQQDFENDAQANAYATALGGHLKYETLPFYGFNAGVAFYTSQDIHSLSGKDELYNSDLSSSKRDYSELGEAYINYAHEGFNIRTGRQILDTPFADSDPIRMVQNSFDATLLTYTKEELTFMAGYITSWQGFDAGLDNGFTSVGTNGAWLASALFANDTLEASLWFYEISDLAKVFYTDAKIGLHGSDKSKLHVSVQYINEQELAKSTVNAQLYGVQSKLELFDIGLTLAYYKALCKKDKTIFNGFGGGSLYTNMDTITLDTLDLECDKEAFMGRLEYQYKDFKIFYSLGNFVSKNNEIANKADIIEQNIGFEYNFNDDFQLIALYAKANDKIDPHNTHSSWDRVQINLTYSFKGKNG